MASPCSGFYVSRLTIPGLFGLLGFQMFASDAQAVPSLARQTGVSCAMCHTTAFGPNLTQYGRDFKMNGYVWGGGPADGKFPPVSGMVVGSFTNTRKDADPPDGGFDRNNNFTFDQASLFYAGRIWDKIGAFSQLTFDGMADRLGLDNTDVRFASDGTLAGHNIVYGISANNVPTVQDLWNTTPIWGFPYVSSPYAAAPGAATLVDGGLGAGQVGGVTAYAMINRMVYLEAGGYGTFGKSFQQGIGTWAPDQNRLDGGAPYWRIALQHDFGGHYVAIGHYGLRANLFPGGNRSNGTDRYTDLGLDATYQYLGSQEHIFEAKTTYIRESQELFASRLAGNTDFSSNQLNAFKLNAAYTYLQTYSLNVGYNRLTGNRNTGLYNTAGGYSVSGKPDSEYFTVELDYVPFGKDSSLLASMMNLRLGLQYVGYSRFNGTSKQAGDFNTLMLNGWLAF